MAVIRVSGELTKINKTNYNNIPNLLSQAFNWYNWVERSKTGHLHVRRKSNYYVDVAARAMGFPDHIVADYALYITFADDDEAIWFKLLYSNPDLQDCA